MKILNELSKKSMDKKDSRLAAIENNPCSLCKLAGLPNCKGHSKSGGGGGETTVQSSEKPSASPDGGVPIVATHVSAPLPELVIDFELLEEALLVKSDNQGIVSFQLRPELNNDQDNQARSFMRMTLTAFNEFKSKLAKLGENVEDLTCIATANELRFRFPSPKFYDAFLDHLLAKKLLMPAHVKQLRELENPLITPNPFSIRPTPLNNTPRPRSKEKESVRPTPVKADPYEEERKDFPTPFRTTPILRNERK